MKKKQSLVMIFLLFILFVFTENVIGWEKPVTIISSSKFTFSYVGSRIEQETGHVYVVYKRRDSQQKVSDIFIRKFDGETVTEVGGNDGNVSQSPSQESYFPHIQIKKGIVHVAWTEHPINNDDAHRIKYRNFDGTKWSAIHDLSAGILSGEVEDLHMDVDDNGNVFVVYMDWGPVKCRLAYKVGDKTGQSVFPMGGRQKHPDIAIAGDTIFVDYQWRPTGGRYSLGTAQRKTTAAGDWFKIEAKVSDHDVARPRITVDDDGFPNYLYHDELGPTRSSWFFKWDGTSFTRGYEMLPQKTYHFSDFATRGGSVFHATQLGDTKGGRGIKYNWKKTDGNWTGGSELPNVTLPRRLAVDLSADGEAAVVVYESAGESIYLIASGEIKGGGSFDAVFSVNPEQVFYNNIVTFTASLVDIPDPDSIKNYIWEFGDGNSSTSTGPEITHTYSIFREEVEVKLTIEMETGETGIGFQTFNIQAPYGAVLDGNPEPIVVKTLIYNRSGYKISWNHNPENETYGYQISKYQIWRALQSGTFPPTDASEYSLVVELNSTVLNFVDYSDNIDSKYNYVYIVRSVDSDGHLSPLFEN